jgi:hypothetical protein
LRNFVSDFENSVTDIDTGVSDLDIFDSAGNAVTGWQDDGASSFDSRRGYLLHRWRRFRDGCVHIDPRALYMRDRVSPAIRNPARAFIPIHPANSCLRMRIACVCFDNAVAAVTALAAESVLEMRDQVFGRCCRRPVCAMQAVLSH